MAHNIAGHRRTPQAMTTPLTHHRWSSHGVTTVQLHYLVLPPHINLPQCNRTLRSLVQPAPERKSSFQSPHPVLMLIVQLDKVSMSPSAGMHL